MPNVAFNTKYFMKRIGQGMDLGKISEQLYKMGFEVESADDKEVKIEVTANRPDLLGAVGMARALRYFVHREKSFTHGLKNRKPELSIDVDASVSGYRPYISGMVVKGIKLDGEALSDLFTFMDKFCDTFGRMRKKLAIGVHNLDAITGDITYAVSKDESMHALRESKPMRYSDLLRQNEKGLKYHGTLDSRKGYPVLKDSMGTLALIPIINSDRTKLSGGTTNLFVDITGTSEYLVGKTADMLASIFMELGGKVGGVAVKYKNSAPKLYPQMEHTQMLISLEKIESEIGVKVGFNNAISLANKMGYEAAFIDGKLRFTIPEYRLDIINEQDIIEDMAIAYGYDFIQPVVVPSISVGALEAKDVLFERVSEALLGMGFSESMNSYLTNIESNFTKMRRKNVPEGTVTIKDAKSTAIEILRTSLLPSLMNNISLSKHEKMPQRLFELDMVFGVRQRRPVESYHVAAVSLDSRSNFNYSKSVVTALLSALGVSFDVKPAEDPGFIGGRCASVLVSGKQVGIFGELHPEVLGNFGIEEPAVAFEMDLSQLYKS